MKANIVKDESLACLYYYTVMSIASDCGNEGSGVAAVAVLMVMTTTTTTTMMMIMIKPMMTMIE